jgi:hypothetical protein
MTCPLKSTFRIFLLFLILLPNASCNSQSEEKSILSSNTGKVIAIIDGDTYDILEDGNKIKQ